MNDDEELCLCFHVTRRKVVQYIRARSPRRVSQLSECYGAGTGCGWCRPFLQRLMNRCDASLPDAESYERRRRRHQNEQPGEATSDE